MVNTGVDSIASLIKYLFKLTPFYDAKVLGSTSDCIWDTKLSSHRPSYLDRLIEFLKFYDVGILEFIGIVLKYGVPVQVISIVCSNFLRVKRIVIDLRVSTKK